MQTTTNYGLKTYEGTDLFNPLVVENPNTETLDTVVKAISDKAVGNATELKTGTVHALSRLNADADRDVFTFRATSAFTAGDTFTLDGEQVSALTVAGEQLSTNCFIIGSTVLVAKRDTLLTFFVAETTAKDAEKLGGELPSHYATASALATIAGYVTALQDKVGTATLTTTAQDCSGAINELNTQLSNLENWAVSQKIAIGKRGNQTIYRYIVSANTDMSSYFNVWYSFQALSSIGFTHVISCRLLSLGDLFDNTAVSFKLVGTVIQMTQSYVQSGAYDINVEIIGY